MIEIPRPTRYGRKLQGKAREQRRDDDVSFRVSVSAYGRRQEPYGVQPGKHATTDPAVMTSAGPSVRFCLRGEHLQNWILKLRFVPAVTAAENDAVECDGGRPDQNPPCRVAKPHVPF